MTHIGILAFVLVIGAYFKIVLFLFLFFQTKIAENRFYILKEEEEK